MINLTSSYRGLPTNQQYTKIQSLPVEIWNPLRNLLFVKEDRDDASSEGGLGSGKSYDSDGSPKKK